MRFVRVPSQHKIPCCCIGIFISSPPSSDNIANWFLILSFIILLRSVLLPRKRRCTRVPIKRYCFLQSNQISKRRCRWKRTERVAPERLKPRAILFSAYQTIFRVVEFENFACATLRRRICFWTRNTIRADKLINLSGLSWRTYNFLPLPSSSMLNIVITYYGHTSRDYVTIIIQVCSSNSQTRQQNQLCSYSIWNCIINYHFTWTIFTFKITIVSILNIRELGTFYKKLYHVKKEHVFKYLKKKKR